MLPPAINIVIADDHAIFRKGLKTVLRNTNSRAFCIVAEAENGKAVLKSVAEKQPHVILMDVQMPEMNGIEATAQIKKLYPQVRVVALSYMNDVEHVLAMARAGADGYLLKDAPVDEIMLAIRTVHQGHSYYTPSISSYLTAQIRDTRKTTEAKPRLTKRETEVLEHICEGDSSKEIAEKLFVSKRTVDTIRNKVIKKTGVKNTLQLLRFAIREKLVKA